MNAVFEEIVQFNVDRDPDLVKLKFERMDSSVFAFFRGTDHLYARHWSALKPADSGPSLLICGDLHLENFGAFRSDEGKYSFDINDFDEAIIGPCSFDLVRFATSTLLAAQDWKLPPLIATSIMWSFVDNYRSTVLNSLRSGNIGSITLENAKSPIRDLLGATSIGDQIELLEKTTVKKQGVRQIERSDKHPQVSNKISNSVKDAVEAYGRSIQVEDAYQVIDVTGRIAGIGSLGLPRYIVLIAGGGHPNQNRLLDLKEERASSVLCCSEVHRVDFASNEASRVVESQRRMQAFPSACLTAIEINGHWFRMREVIPDENRSGLDRLAKKPEKLRSAVEIAGQLTAWAHLRGNRGQKGDLSAKIGQWASGPGLESTLSSAIRFANQIELDYEEFRDGFKKHGGLKTS